MMRLLVSVLILGLSLPISSVFGAAAKGEACCDNNQCSTQVTCGEGLSCCYQRPVWMESIGGTCYDPKTESCADCPVYNPNHPQTQVCPSSSPTCCGGCINSTLQCCHHYLSYDFHTCPSDKTCCGFSSGAGSCCDSNQDCINDVCVTKQASTTTTLPTPAPGCVIPGDLKCGSRCYSPSTHVCTNAATELLCPVAYPNQCGAGCYSSSQYSCDNGQLKPIDSAPAATQPPATTSAPTGAAARGEACCDNNQCSQQVTCGEGLSCCYQRPQWMEYIGGTCYDPKIESCADCPVYNPNHPQTQVCPSSSPTCCGGCLNSTLQCCHHYGSYNFFPCPSDKTCCGFSGSGACCDSNQDCINDVCVAKQTSTTTSTPTAVPGCVLIGDLKCGDRCYNPNTHVCADAGSSFLCSTAYPSKCGDACYSPAQYKCENGQLKGL